MEDIMFFGGSRVALKACRVRMTKKCAWCDTIMEQGDDDAPVTHGICAACRDLALADADARYPKEER